MQIVQECLQQMMVSKPQAKFMTVLLSALLVVRGKVNYRNLSSTLHD